MRFLGLLVFIVLVKEVDAATITAASASKTHVQTALNSAADGDTVEVPAGTATWSNPADFTHAVTNLSTRGIRLIGAGIGQTIIRADTAGFSGCATLGFYGQNSSSSLTRISGFTFIDTNGSGHSCVQIQLADTASSVFRIDNCLFTNIISRGIMIYNDARGVIDHCGFVCPVSGTGVSADGSGVRSSNEWANAWIAGTTNGIVIEDCWYDWKTTGANGFTDCYGGAKTTVRYTTGTNSNIGSHGTDSSGDVRSILGFEHYLSTVYVNVDIFPYQHRGGSQLIWSNNLVILSGGSASLGKVDLAQYRNTGINVYPGTAPIGCCTPWGPATATNHWDGQSNAMAWPALDQIGRTGPSIYNANNTEQRFHGTYIWGNTRDGGTGPTNYNDANIGPNQDNTGIYSHIANPTNMIVVDRDVFYGIAKPGYVPLVYPHPLLSLDDGVTGTRTKTLKQRGNKR